MKHMFVTVILFSVNAFATLDCQSTDADKLGYRLIVTKKTPPRSVLTIKYKGKNIHQEIVRWSAKLGGSAGYYRSLPFTNRNNAPAQLYLNIRKIYTQNQIEGNFSESSDHPVVPNLQLSCKIF